MSKTNSGDDGSTVFETDEERAEARATLREAFNDGVDVEIDDDDVDDVLDSLAEDDVASNREETLYLAARTKGWSREDCDHAEPLCAHDEAALGVGPTNTNAADGCTCGGAGGVETDLEPEDDPGFTDGQSDEYPAGTRSAWDARQEGTGESTVNYAGVPGGFDRRAEPDAPDDDFPAGGRSAWERRQMGLSQTRENAEPAGSRSAWEDQQDRGVRAKYPLSIRWRDSERQARANARRRRRRRAGFPVESEGDR